ncbi:hypothetical protein DPQ22_03000 [Candidatus Tokpelaia sp.]|nr:hypothetical protein DPQ22_03000 [Candidatus Tokpelaia sp.]
MWRCRLTANGVIHAMGFILVLARLFRRHNGAVNGRGQMRKRCSFWRQFRPIKRGNLRLSAFALCLSLIFGPAAAVTGLAAAAPAPMPLLEGAAGGTGHSSEDAEKSWFLSFIESRLSTPDRRIRMAQIEGVLSGKASIGLITIADRQGIWLKIHSAKLDWNRLALLRGRVSINSLTADSVEILRRPAATEEKPLSLKVNSDFSLPHLPLGIKIEALAISRLLLGEELTGQAASLSLTGRLSLSGGRLEADIAAARLDNAAGRARLVLRYDNATGDMALDSSINEPENGLLANILNIEERPSLSFSARGGGTGGLLKFDIYMEAASRPIMDAVLNVSPAAGHKRAEEAGKYAPDNMGQAGDRFMFNVTAAGAPAAIMPAAWRPFWGTKTALTLRGALKAGGGLRLDEFLLNGDFIHLSAQAEIMADGFLRRLLVDGALGGAAVRAAGPPGQDAGAAVILPVKGGASSLQSLRLNIDYGAVGAETWAGRLYVHNWQNEAAYIENITLIMGGVAENLDNAVARHISATLTGGLQNMALTPTGGDVTTMSQIDIGLAADWRAGQPLMVQKADIAGQGLLFAAKGAVESGQFTGTMRFAAANIADFAKIWGQKLAGSADMRLQGVFGLKNGAFNIDIAGSASRLHAANAGLNGLLRSDITVSGGLKRDNTGVSARNLRLGNAQFQLYANGDWHEDAANMDFGLNLADMALLVPFVNIMAEQALAAPADQAAQPENTARKGGAAGNAGNIAGGLASKAGAGDKAGGALVLRGAARGHNRLIAVALQAGIAEGRWNGRALHNIRLGLNALLDNSSLPKVYRSAAITGEGVVDGDPMQLGAALYQADKSWRLDNFRLVLGEALLNGFLHKQQQGLRRGAIRLKADNIAPLAALAFMQGTGKADIDIRLQAEPAAGGGRRAVPPAQNLTFRLMVEGLALDYPSIGPAAAKQAAARPLMLVRNLQGEGAVRDIFALPRVSGRLEGQMLHYGPYSIEHLAINSRNDGQDSAMTVAAVARDGLSIVGKGVIAPLAPVSQAANEQSGQNAANWQFLLQGLTVRGGQTGAAAGFAGDIIRRGGKTGAGEQVEQQSLGLYSAQEARFIFSKNRLLGVEGLVLRFSRPSIPGPAGARSIIMRRAQRQGVARQAISPGNVSGMQAPSAFIRLDGRLSDKADWVVSAQNLPLALANILRPELGLRGVLNGTAHIKQDIKSAPIVDFNVTIKEASSFVLAQAGLAPIYAQAQGQTKNSVLDFTAVLASSEPDKNNRAGTGKQVGPALRGSGKIFLAARKLQVNAAIDNMPLGLLPEIIHHPVVTAQNWRGFITAHAVIDGSFDAPQLRFAAAAEHVTAPLLAAGKIAPLAIRAEGRADKQAVQLDRLVLHEAGKIPAREPAAMRGARAAELTGKDLRAVMPGLAGDRHEGSGAKLDRPASGGAPQTPAIGLAGAPELASSGRAGNMYFTASGRLPLNGAGLNLRAEGSLPLALANGFLQAQGMQLGGMLIVNSVFSGSLQQPQMQGRFAVRRGQFFAVPVNLRLQPIEITGHLQGSNIVFDKAVLQSANGGAIMLGGSLGVNRQAGFPLRLQLNFDRFQYNDGSTMAVKLGGALTIGGAVLQGADIGGAINIAKAEIRVPDNIGRTIMLEIENKRTSGPVALTQKRAGRIDNKTPKAAAAAAAQARLLPRLNIQVSAPNQIFVRGRGLSAEMGGRLHLLGRVDDMRPNGGFNLIRGRLDILTQRLTFRQGQVNLAGSLNPDLNFVAVSSNDDVTVTVKLAGTPKDLKITLSSTPDLPQDEILARLVFNRSLSELSPLQVAQLVDAAAELTGASQGSVLGKLRAGAGLDNLDITTDAAGNAGLAAGRYLVDKLYMGVETSSSGASRGTVNLDISKNLKAKGAMDSDSNSSVGVFYERDY